MPAILQVLVNGISVYFPDTSGPNTFTVAVLGTGFLPDYSPRHVAHLLIPKHNVRNPAGQTNNVDEILHRQDVVLYDGGDPIAAVPQARQLDRVLKLTQAPFSLPSSIAGIADRETLHQHCSARVTFRGGTVEAINPTPEKWVVVAESDCAGADPKTAPAELMQGLKFTRKLKNDWMVLEVATGGTVNLRYELQADAADTIQIGISNEDVPARHPEDGKNRDEDFRLVYKLFGYTGPALHFPQQDEATFANKGVHLPCVGGCTC